MSEVQSFFELPNILQLNIFKKYKFYFLKNRDREREELQNKVQKQGPGQNPALSINDRFTCSINFIER